MTPPTASPLDACLRATQAAFEAARPADADEDVHMVPAVVDHVIERCTRAGDLVLDPFAGFGTTLARAVALGRQAWGVELLPERVASVRERVPDARIVEGDARDLLSVVGEELSRTPRAAVDLVLTSPPYLAATDRSPDPLTGYADGVGEYGRYLRELGLVAAQCAEVVRPGGFVVWNVADIHDEGHTTHLVADCARVLGAYLDVVGIVPIVWDALPHDLVADALVVGRRPGS